MASVIFSNAQRIISQIFQWLQISGQTKTNNIILDTFSSGIDNATTSGEGFLIVPGTNNTSLTPTVNCTLESIAYDPMGSRIFISASDTTLYNSGNVNDTTNDGLGNFLSTPQSTGVVNIPVVQSSQNYIWVNYLATIDTSAFTLNKETEAKIFYKQTDGYNIQVTQVNVPPNANSIYLANVNMLSGGAVAPSNISQVGRSFYQILPNIVPITTPLADSSDRTPQYAPASTYTLEAHIKAVGTGTGISPFNPHNMSLADLGVSQFDTVAAHRQLEHGNAIIAGVPGTPYPSTSAMATSINIINPGSDTINVFQLLSSEFAIINGTAFNVNAIFGAVPTNATIVFPDVSATYNVYWDSLTKVFSVTTSDISGDVTKLWLATVTYTFVGHGISDHNSLSSLIDRRRIGSTTHLLQRWITSARPGSGSTAPESGEFGFNLSTNLLEYWDGSAWQQPVNVSANATVPTGSILEFAGAVAPSGFLMANGASHAVASFPNLFAVIGYTYGGSGANFNVPNKIDKVGVGTGGSIVPTLGSTAGATSVTPTENSHFHISNSLGVGGALYVGTTSSWPFGETNVTTASTEVAATNNPSATIPFANTSTETATINPVSVVQPSIGLNYIIKI